LFDNAGIPQQGEEGVRPNARNTPVELWKDIFSVNVLVRMMLARGFIEELKRAKVTILNVTSIPGSLVHPYAGAAYASSKAVLATLSRGIAADFETLGIRVNSIAPGETHTTNNW
jgi:NAD(P)-dependent dehydrogenase (short-subunit alcohol dehydrogenase family)